MPFPDPSSQVNIREKYIPRPCTSPPFFSSRSAGYTLYAFRSVEQRVSICTEVDDQYWVLRAVFGSEQARVHTRARTQPMCAPVCIPGPITYLRTPSKLTLGAGIVLFASMNRANCAQKITGIYLHFPFTTFVIIQQLRKQL